MIADWSNPVSNSQGAKQTINPNGDWYSQWVFHPV